MEDMTERIVTDERAAQQACPKCGETDEWYPTGRVRSCDLDVAMKGGPMAPVEMSIKGGHCLRCGHEEEAVYA